ncbi:MAG: M48 family metallopeptidase [Clostridium sp.]
MQIEYKNKVIEFQVIKRKRKSICIKVDTDSRVTVITPLRMPDEKIIDIVMKKASWISEKQKQMSRADSRKIIRKFEDGSTFMYLGNEYPLHIVYGTEYKGTRAVLGKKTLKSPYDDTHFIIYTNTQDEDEMRKALEKWYREQTKEIVLKKIKLYENFFKDKVSEVRVKEQKRRWASCTGKNAILFNWRCSMAREDVIEYIVLHEMCHFVHRNHSKDFWNLVEEIMPDYKEKHEYLKANGMNMYI